MVKDGFKTSEFWITVVVNLAAAVLGILAARGLVSKEESELWIDLARAVVAAIAPVVMALVTKSYVAGRAEVKAAASYAAEAAVRISRQ